MPGSTIIEIVIGAIVAIVITIWIERLRKPKLKLKIGKAINLSSQEIPNAGKFHRHLYVLLENKPLSKWLSWMTRNPAIQCHGHISFHHLDGQNYSGRTMPIRWSGRPEPVLPWFEIDERRIPIIDYTRLRLESYMDIHPGEQEELDIAVRFDNNDECYGWTNESYFRQLRHPDWRLPPGRYLVKVVVVTAGEKTSEVLRLVNDVPWKDFRLEEAKKEDKGKVE